MALAFVHLTACNEDKQAYAPKIEMEIMQAIEDQRLAWNKGDLDAFMSWYLQGDDLRFTTSRGMVRGSDALHLRYQDSYPDQVRMGTLQFDVLEFQAISPTYAVVIGKWILLRVDDRPEGYFTLMWVKTPEGWRIAVDHTS
jgi:ketosteroid isomerase-like protein